MRVLLARFPIWWNRKRFHQIGNARTGIGAATGTFRSADSSRTERALATAALLVLAACTQPQGTASSCPAPLRPAVEVNLYFGGDAGNGRAVSEAEWAAFMTEEVTPRFPDGLTVIDVAGQYREPSGRMVREKTKLIVVVIFDAPTHLARVQAVIDAYNRRHSQNSVFRVEHAACAGG